MMSIQSKREFLQEVNSRSRSACRKDKRQILNAFAGTTLYHRKYAIQLLNHPSKARRHKERHGNRRYGIEVNHVLLIIPKRFASAALVMPYTLGLL